MITVSSNEQGLPHAGEVIFDRTHPGYPPDIVFSLEDDIIEFEPNIDQLEVGSF